VRPAAWDLGGLRGATKFTGRGGGGVLKHTLQLTIGSFFYVFDDFYFFLILCLFFSGEFCIVPNGTYL